MQKAYLIIDSSISSAEIMKKFYFFRWDWRDEIEETKTSPWTSFFEEDETETTIYWRQENKPFSTARYFYLEGEEIEAVVEQLRANIPLFSSEDLIAQLKEENDTLKRKAAIYQLGICWCGQPFQAHIYEVFHQVLAKEQWEVKIAALNAMAWLGWSKMDSLIELAKEDMNPEVVKYAQYLLNAISRAKE